MIDFDIAGREKLREIHQSMGQTLASARRENEGTIGDTVVKILTVIAGIFLIIAAAAAPNPQVAFIAVPIVLLVGALVFMNAKSIIRFIVSLKLIEILSRRPQGHTTHDVYHYRTGGGGHQMGGQGGHHVGNQGGHQGGHQMGEPEINHPPRSASDFRENPPGSHPNPSPSGGNAQFGSGHGNTATTPGADGRQQGAFGGGHSDTATTQGANGQAQVAFGGGHQNDRSKTATGQVPFGGRN